MKTVTVILIILFISAAAIFTFAAWKAFTGTRDGEIPAAEELSGVDEVLQEPDTGAAEQDSQEELDTGSIAAIKIYLDGPQDKGILLGEAELGLTSRTAYSIYGEEMSQSGFLLVNEDSDLEFAPGSVHYLYIYTLIPAYGWEYIRYRTIAVGDPVLSDDIELHIDSPGSDAVIAADTEELIISGWSADLSSENGPDIEEIEIYLNGPRGFGEFLGKVDYGIERQDVADTMGNTLYANTGYSLAFDTSGLEPGSENSIYVYSFSSSGIHTVAIRDIIVEGEKEDSNAIISVEASLEDSSAIVSGWAVSRDNILDAKPRDTGIEYVDKKIVFVSNKNGNEDIYIMNIDGTELTQLTDSSNADSYPVGSTDGQKIAYTSEIDGYWQIMLMDIDGKNKIQLTDDQVRSGCPAFSYDGRYIFYEVLEDGDWELYRMNSDGSSRKRLTFNMDAYDWHPFGHPFLSKVIYESGLRGTEKIYMMDYNGGSIQRLSSDDMRMRVSEMSVDGEYIVFMGEGESRQVYIMDGSGENISLVSQRPDSEHPTISPDNQLIAFNSYINGQSEIFIINIDGSGETRLTSIPGEDWGPSFIYQLP